MSSARAVVLSSADVGGERLLVHSCEDCACAVSPAAPAPVPAIGKSPAPLAGWWVRGEETIELPLDADHHVLFNPVGSGGAVVVNAPAQRILRAFQRPASLDSLRPQFVNQLDDLQPAVSRLAQLEIIHPVGHPCRPVIGGSRMLTAWLHVTNACNLRCPYCYVHKSSEKMDESVGHAAVEAVMRAAVRQRIPAVKLKYAGGEASLNHHLVLDLHAHAVALADEHGLELHASLLSNGVVLPAALMDALKSAGIQIMVSLDGIGERHDAQRPFINGKPSFSLVEQTIARLVAFGHRPHLSITVTTRNAVGLADVVRYALDRDLTFSLNLFRDNDCAAGVEGLRYGESEMISAMLQSFAVIEKYLPPWSVLGSVLDRGQLIQPRLRSCGVGQDYVVIDQRGRVAKCHMEIERTLGDVFTDDPLDLVRRDKTTVLGLSVEQKQGCRSCTWRYWCSGGCPVATFRATGRYDLKSPNCNIYKAIYPAALRLEGLRLIKYAAEAPRPAGPGVTGPGEPDA